MPTSLSTFLHNRVPSLPSLQRSSWPLRTAVAVLAGSTAYLMGPRHGGILEGRLLGPVVACLCTNRTLGETLAAAWALSVGILAGCILALGANACLSWSSVSLYAAQALLSMALLYFQKSVVQTKLCWVILTISVATSIKSLREDVDVRIIQPLLVSLSAYFGVAAAVFVAYLPFPHSRATATAEALLQDASEHAARAMDDLSRAFGEQDVSVDHSKTFVIRRQKHALLETNRADHLAKGEKALHQAASYLEKARMLLNVVWWENLLMSAGTVPFNSINYLRFDDAADSQVPKLEWKEKMLSTVIMMGGGMVRALKVSREEEKFHSLPLPQHLLAQAKASSDVGDKECAADLVELAKLIATKDETSDQFRTGVSPQILALGGCLRAWITASNDQKSANKYSKALQDAVHSFEDLWDHVRKELYYTSHGQGRQRVETLAFSAWGPPIHYGFFCFCIKTCSHALLELSCEKTKYTESKSVADWSRQWWNTKLQEIKSAWSPPEIKNAFSLQKPSNIQAARLIYAAKLSAAMVISMYLGDIVIGSALWAGVAVAVIAPRDSLRGGGSFMVVSQRINGTVIGSLFGFFAAMSAGVGDPIGYGHLALLVTWVYICGFVRSGKHSYGAFVAQFTPFVMIEAPASLGAVGYELWAFRRIQQNLIGCTVFVILEVLILPIFSSVLLHRRLIKDLRLAAKCVRLIWDAEIGIKCPKCSERIQNLASETLQQQTKGIKKQKEMVQEIRHEPEWYTGRETDVRTYEHLINVEESHVSVVLNLMQMVLARWWQSISTSEDVRVHIADVFSSLEGRLKALKMAVADWFEQIAEDLETSAPTSDGEAYICEERAVTALHMFELKLFSKVSSFAAETRARNGDPPPNNSLIPLYSLIFLTRELVRAVADVSRHSRMLRVVNNKSKGTSATAAPQSNGEADGEAVPPSSSHHLDKQHPLFNKATSVESDEELENSARTAGSAGTKAVGSMNGRRSRSRSCRSISSISEQWKKARKESVKSFNAVSRWLEEIQNVDEDAPGGRSPESEDAICARDKARTEVLTGQSSNLVIDRTSSIGGVWIDKTCSCQHSLQADLKC